MRSSDSSRSVIEWLAAASSRLHPATDSPRLDAELLLMHVLEVNRSWLFAWPEKLLESEQQAKADELLKRRILGEPIAYLTGTREFWSLPLAVNPSTLIPRPDTETLVEWALDLDLPEDAAVLDLGTGTGAIALALASEKPDWNITAVDLNPGAVELAKHNAQALDLNVTILQSSWFDKVAGRFDLIVSNPPYIDPVDEHLQRGDVRFEPHSALIARDHGMADLRYIVEQSGEYLNDGGWLLLEHGYDQAQGVCKLLEQQGYSSVSTHHDLGGQPRISGGQYLQKGGSGGEG